MNAFEKKVVALSGVVAVLRVTMTSDNPNDEGVLYREALEQKSEIRAYLDAQVREILGGQFQVYDVDVDEGSAIILAHIEAVGTVFMGFSRYESFIKSLTLLTEQVSGIVDFMFRGRRKLPHPSVFVSRSVWIPGTPMQAANQAIASDSRLNVNLLFVGYLVLTNLILIMLFIWLFVHHMR